MNTFNVGDTVIWDSITDHHHIYTSETLLAAAEHLEAADVVLSFNGIEFDIPVLEGCIGRRVETKIHLDLLRLIWSAISGRRKGNTLDETSKRTLGRGRLDVAPPPPASPPKDAGRNAKGNVLPFAARKRRAG